MVNADEVPVVGLVTVLVRRRWLVMFAWFAAALVAILVVVVRGRTYVASAEFAPQSPRAGGSRLAGLAAQLGVDVGLPVSGEPLQFYAALLQSRELLESTSLAEYRVIVGPGVQDSLFGTLLDLLRVRGSDERDRSRNGVKRLSSNLTVDIDPRANIVTVKVTQPWPGLAEQVNRRVLDLVNDFNLKRRQSEAGAERRFVEGRMSEAQQELREAEDAYGRFLEANRLYQSSPQLVFQGSRLQRKVDLLQGVYATLAQAYEQARIEEVRNTPVITIVDSPEGSARPQRGLLRILLISSVLGVSAGVILAFLFENLARQRKANPGAYEELRRELRVLAGRRGPQ
jgi:uncharacterized protein involved in exopolysaccharide biosynthesis